MNLHCASEVGAPSWPETYVDRLGTALETGSVTRASGRMLGWLLVCDPPAQSVEQLSVGLNTRAGAVSGTASELVRLGLLERVGVAGSRRIHYRLRSDAWRTALDTRRERASALRALAEEGLVLLETSSFARRERLLSMHHLFAFLEAEFLTTPVATPTQKGPDHA
ncbi:MAG: helix-turn-helix domain-containing protein [Ornithinimicrobium sp.]